MKASNAVVSVIVIAAVLVAAYALGLLIRQARTGSSHVSPVREVNDTVVAPRTGPRAASTKDSPEERTRLKEEKAKAIEKMNSSTEEQKEKFRSQVRKQVGGGRSGQGLPNVSPEQQQTRKTKAQRQSETGQKPADTNSPTPQGDGTSTKPSTDKAGSEPGKAGPG